MSGRSRSVLLASLVPAVLLGGAFAVAQADTERRRPRRRNWSDPNTWPNRKVPVAGDKVTIGRDKEVILDVSPPALRRPDHRRQAQLRERLPTSS